MARTNPNRRRRRPPRVASEENGGVGIEGRAPAEEARGEEIPKAPAHERGDLVRRLRGRIAGSRSGRRGEPAQCGGAVERMLDQLGLPGGEAREALRRAVASRNKSAVAKAAADLATAGMASVAGGVGDAANGGFGVSAGVAAPADGGGAKAAPLGDSAGAKRRPVLMRPGGPWLK